MSSAKQPVVRWTRDEIRRIYEHEDENAAAHRWTIDEFKEMYEPKQNADSDDDTVVPDSEDTIYDHLLLSAQDAAKNKVSGATWMVETLSHLAKNRKKEVTNELSTDLVSLWKRIENKPVIKYLVENDFLKTAENILNTSSDSCLKEVVLIIVNSMCKDTRGMKVLRNSKEFMTILFNLLTCGNVGTVIEAVHLLGVAARDIRINPKTSLCLECLKEWESFGEVIVQLLLDFKNSKDLVRAVTELTYTLSEAQVPRLDLLKEFFNMKQLTSAMLTSYLEITPPQLCTMSENTAKFVEKWLEVLFKIMQIDMEPFKEEQSENRKKLMKILLNIMRPYKQQYNIIPVKEIISYVILQCLEIMQWCKSKMVDVEPELNLIAAIVLNTLMIKDIQNRPRADPDEALMMLLNFMHLYWFKVFLDYSVPEINDIVSLCNEVVVESLADVFRIAGSKVDALGAEKVAGIKNCLRIYS